MTTIPAEQIADAHKLNADAEIDIFELTPATGTGTFRFKADNSHTWRDNQYFGLPLKFTGETFSSSRGSPQPNLTIGDTNVDLSIFKPLVYDGSIDGSLIIRRHFLLANLLSNSSIHSVHYYRVKRVIEYSMIKISLQLASETDSMSTTMPFRTYTPPDFPAVLI